MHASLQLAILAVSPVQKPVGDEELRIINLAYFVHALITYTVTRIDKIGDFALKYVYILYFWNYYIIKILLTTQFLIMQASRGVFVWKLTKPVDKN